MKKRKGSALASVLIIFTIIMVFGTVTLSLAVNESKQSVRQQNKTQAYYIARSGAETVEKAILKVYANEEEKDLYNNFTSALKISKEIVKGDFSGIGDPEVKIWKEVKGSDKINIHIISTGKANGIQISVEKVIPVDITPGESEKIRLGGKPIVAENFEFESEVHKDIIEKKKDWVEEIDNFHSLYPPYNFEYDSYSDVPRENVGNYSEDKPTLGVVGETTNYFLDNLTIGSGTNITIEGKVNIYIKNNVTIRGAGININKDGNKDDLNFYVYGEDDTGNSLSIRSDNKEIHIEGNFYVNSGNIYYYGDESYMEGNIISNGKKITINTQTSANKDDILGIIYAPKSTIHISPGGSNSTFQFKGYLIAEKITMGVTHHNKTTIVPADGTGITNPDIIPGLDVMITKPGYYK